MMTMSVCLSVCLRAYLRTDACDLHHIFCARYLCPRLGHPLATLQYVMYFRFCGVHIYTQWAMCRDAGVPVEQPASQPDGATRPLGRGPWLKQQAVSP